MRKRLLLDCDWKFHLGEISQNIGKGHGDIYNLSKAGSCPGVPQGDFDTSHWETVQLPHDWSILQPFSENNVADWGYKSRGKAWYRKSFLLKEEYLGQRIHLSFEGIATHAVVYFNGMVVARNYTGYAPFEVDVTDMARFGEVPNILAVFVDADVWEGWWYEGAGIYRHVWLDVLNPVHMEKDSVFVYCSQQEEQWKTAVSLELVNNTCANHEITLEWKLLEPVGNQEIKSMMQTVDCAPGLTQFAMDFSVENPLLWDIDSPNVYQVIVIAREGEAIIDQVETVCGFRTLEICKDRGFLLNHKPVKLYGTCNHQDFGGLGVAVPDNLWEYRIEKLKEMGSNAYRCAHGMPSDALIEACDRMGMLVMDENRNYDASQEGLKQLETLVKRHRNHPSVIMYSIFNEEPLQGTLQGQQMAETMCKRIHELAPGSITTGAMHGGILTEYNAAQKVDVCGINYQIDSYDSFHEKYPEIPIVATETTSTFAVRGCYKTMEETHEIASYDEDASSWGNNVRDTWKAIMEREFVAGGFMWTGFDYLGEPSPHVWPSVSSFFGMLDICGFPKDGFYLSKAIFSREPVCHVLPHWNWKGKEGSIIKVMSHTNCSEAELFVNGKSYGKKEIDLFQQAVWDVIYEPGKLVLIGYENGKEVARSERETTGSVETLGLIPWKEQIVDNHMDAMPIMIQAVDGEGREVPDANFLTEIDVVGGKVIGTCNGNPNCHEEFFGTKRSIFNGKCLAIVKPEKGVQEMLIRVVSSVDGKELVSERRLTVLSEEFPIESIPTVTEQYLTEWKISKVFSEKPDVLMKIEDYDMNSWQNISVNKESGSPDCFAHKQGCYLIYQNKVNIPKNINGHLPNLYFHGIWGICDIYINGKKYGFCDYEWPSEYNLSIEPEDTGKVEIRILVKSRNMNAGLHSLVVLR